MIYTDVNIFISWCHLISSFRLTINWWLIVCCLSLPSLVLATDCDSGLNAELTYYTLSPDFSISPHGTVFPAGRLDYERPNHLYEFVVMAMDSGDEPHSGTATVRVRMANINDEAPEFSQPVWASLSLIFYIYVPIPFIFFSCFSQAASCVFFLPHTIIKWSPRCEL